MEKCLSSVHLEDLSEHQAIGQSQVRRRKPTNGRRHWLIILLIFLAFMGRAWSQIVVVDDGGGDNVGGDTSLALNGLGNPVISYRDITNNELKIAVCGDATCSGPPVTNTLDTGGAFFTVGAFASLKLNGFGNPMVAYWDSGLSAPKLAGCVDPTCSGGTTVSTLDSGFVGPFTSLVLNGFNFPVVSYYDSSAGALLIATCGDSICAGLPTIRTVDDSGADDVGRYTSLLLNGLGNPVISYYDVTNGALKLAVCIDPTCTFGGISTLPVDTGGGDDVGQHTSLQLDAVGNPVISYYDVTNGDLKLALCADATCTAATINTVDNGAGADVGQYTSLQLDAAGNPVISYYDATNGNLKLALCADPACSAGTTIHVADDGDGANVGQHTSLQLDAAGDPLISYYDVTNGDLKLAQAPLGVVSFTVTNTSDSGPGSFRQALELANVAPDQQLIDFAIPGTGPHTIQPLSPLPAISDTVFINAETQSGTSCPPRTLQVVLNGDLAGTGAGLRVSTDNTIIRGLVINGFDGNGLELLDPGSGTGGSNTVECSFFGTDVDAAVAVPNTGSGIFIETSNNQIGGSVPGQGNLISGNGQHGIQLLQNSFSTITGNRIQNNRIGTNGLGTAVVPNTLDGVLLDSGVNNTLIGGGGTDEGNQISGNGSIGVLSSGVGNDGTVIQGNAIGVNAAGTAALPNDFQGLRLLDAVDTQVGGSVLGEGNVIAGSAVSGAVGLFSLDGVTIQGNRLGTDGTGSTGFGFFGPGISVFESEGVQIGGGGVNEGNLISGHDGGILIDNTAPLDVTVQGNFIGTDSTGTGIIGNTDFGIRLTIADDASPLAPNIVIGGTVAQGNVIAGNGGTGIDVNTEDPDTMVAITGNAIGTDSAGSLDMGNGGEGILVRGGSANSIQIGDGGLGNLIKHNSDGVVVVNTPPRLIDNRIEDNDNRGIALTSGGIAVNTGNCITGNPGSGFANTSGVASIAESNWWGASDGPSGAGPGSGDSISAGVDAEPFLTSPPTGCNITVLDVDLAVSISDNPDPVAVGNSAANLVYQVTLTNLSGGVDATTVTVDLNTALLAGLTFNVTPATGSFSAPTWTVDVAGGATAMLTVSVTVPDGTAPGTDVIQLGASITGADQVLINPGNDTASQATSVVQLSLDIDGDGQILPLTDGLLILRYMDDFTGTDLIADAVGSGATRATVEEITQWLTLLDDAGVLDFDDNGLVELETDGYLLARYLFGYQGDDLVDQVIGAGAGRDDPDDIEDYIEEFVIKRGGFEAGP